MAKDANLKRKAISTAPTHTGSKTPTAKRLKINDSRTIRVQNSHKALNQNGELDVAAFVKSHEYEIKALENSMVETKKTLSNRAFQQVPRELRRRTASHNVKKVPKRLRNRAAREMREDNTPTVTARRRALSGKQRLREDMAKTKSVTVHQTQEASEQNVLVDAKPLKEAPGGNATVLTKRFKKRQIHKSWLPTHLYHTKRAHMTPPQDPMWRFCIPLTPTDKCYRTVHRASTLRGCVAWDMSYISSIGIKGKGKSLTHLLRSMGIPEAETTLDKGKKWRAGSISWSGWLQECDNEKRLISRVVVIWDALQTEEDERQLLVRVHPSAFLQLWNEFFRSAKMLKSSVKIEDLRFELGTIEVKGPMATEALVGTFQPITDQEDVSCSWSQLASITDLRSLPANVILNFAISDPRLGQPHQRLESTRELVDDERRLLNLSNWSFDHNMEANSLFSSQARSDASRLLPSQKSINRRKGDAPAGSHPVPLPADPRIPALFLANNDDKENSFIGSWTVILPWKSVSAAWYSLMHYPISCGGQIQLGGLLEQRQIHFDNGVPWFPADFPATASGWQWELSERVERKKNWEKRPKGRRIEWDSLDLGKGRRGELGAGWACDWETLFKPGTQSTTKDTVSYLTDKDNSTRNSTLPFGMHHTFISPLALPKIPVDPLALITVSIYLLRRGHAGPCARIYRLPTNDLVLRSAWMAQTAPNRNGALNYSSLGRKGPDHPSTMPTDESRAALAASLLEPSSPLPNNNTTRSASNASAYKYPVVPDEEDLVGFVTSGNYNLGQGRSTGVGSLLLERVIKSTETRGKGGRLGGLCIIREAGLALGRLARWEII